MCKFLTLPILIPDEKRNLMEMFIFTHLVVPENVL